MAQLQYWDAVDSNWVLNEPTTRVGRPEPNREFPLLSFKNNYLALSRE